MIQEIITPSVPNFVKVRVGRKEIVTIPVQELSEEEIKEIGRRWTDDLLVSANKKRLSAIG